MMKKLSIVLGLALLVFLIAFFVVPVVEVSYTATESYQATETYYETEPYTVMEEYSTTQYRNLVLWDNESFGVSAGYYQPYYYYIDIAGKTGNFVTGNVQSLAGGEFLFYVFDQKNYNAWRNNQSYQPNIAPGRVTNYNFSFVPDHTDYYYFVFSNTFSFFTNKLIQFSADWDWQETETEMREVTRYREVPKQRTVQETRPITLYKKVSLFEYLVSY